ncbi:MAG: alpha/beta hydrolase [Kiritimatiellae bacterium]|nr:alpha/beta hydrolase [Verrucomicrobiota bacterium]MCG2660922.1 alpha/beta hydrolase [Kiritimatiellia bacterium]
MKALPLILIAGWGHTGEAMLHLKAALDGHPMDGHPIQVTSTGELWQTQSSGALPSSPGLSRYAVGLHNLLATFGGRVGVIGWSMGGIVALETAREYPGLLQRLVIISGTARFSAGNDEFPGVSASVLRAMALGLRRTPDNVLAAYYDQVHAPQSGPVAAPRNLAIAQLDRSELLPGLDYLQRMDMRNGLDKQTVPTLVVHGREDRIVPWQAGEWLSRALAVSRWRCYENYGHALPIQAPLLLAADIRAFLGDAA